MAAREIRDTAETTMVIITGEAGVAHPTETGGMRGAAGILETRGERMKETDLPEEMVEIETETP